MPRNAEVIRQWTILREIERARGGGVTIDELAAMCAVTTRTIRRDLQALEESGFPLFDDPTRRHDNPRQQLFIARALEATLHLRQANLTYHSKSSDRTKTYLVHPYRLAYALGGLYLLAYVPEYREVRTFAVERIQDVSLLEDKFTPIEELPEAAFPHSLGVHSAPPERVELEFQSAVAEYVRSREWHASQAFTDES